MCSRNRLMISDPHFHDDGSASAGIKPRIVYTPAMVWKPCVDRIIAVCYLAAQIPTLHVRERIMARVHM